MKRQIRRGCFETNSSSQHSLCIMKKDEHYTPEEILYDNEIISKLRSIGQESIFLNIYFLILTVLIIFQTILVCTNIFYFSKFVIC